MIKYAALPVLALVAGCSAEVDNGEAAEANVVETLSVNNLVITDANAATAVADEEMEVAPVRPEETEAPARDTSAARTTSAEPRRQAVRKPSTEAAAKPASPPTAQPEAEPEGPAGTCTAEHRAMGHC